MGRRHWCFNAFLLIQFCRINYSFAKIHHFDIKGPAVVLTNIGFSLSLVNLQLNETENQVVHYTIQEKDHVLAKGSFSKNHHLEHFQSDSFVVNHLFVAHSGSIKLSVTLESLLPNLLPQTNETMTRKLPSKYHQQQKKSIFATDYIELHAISSWLSLLPPLITLLVTAASGQVTLGVLMGVWCGSTLLHYCNPYIGFLRTFDTYWLHALTDNEHAGVLLFTILLGGTIGLISKSGGAYGLGRSLVKIINTRTKMQMLSWILCLVIFFDDYSCILIVGSALREMLQQTGVSKEKFAVIIHSIGVCLPSLAPMSAWIGVEVGYVAAQLEQLHLQWDPYLTCLRCIPYRFFPILMVAFILILILFERDFGPIVSFEQEALDSKSSQSTSASINTEIHTLINPGPTDPEPHVPSRWINAVLPFAFIILVTFGGMIYDGINVINSLPKEERPELSLVNALRRSDSIAALIRSSAGGWLIATLMYLMQRILTVSDCMEAWMHGIKEVMEPVIVLLLAWTLGKVIEDLQAAQFLCSILGNDLPPTWLPGLSALFCYIVSFATGSSLGTMTIMFPIVCPLAFRISEANEDILLQCIGSILGGSVFGNTCSPIADTSILTCLATKCSLSNHIKTILPYTSLVALVALIGGSFPVGLGIYSVFTACGISLTILMFLVSILGNVTDLETAIWSPYSDISNYDKTKEKEPLLFK